MPASQFRPDLKGLVLSSGKSLEAAKALASSLDAHFPTTAYNSFFDRNNVTILNEFLKKLLLIDVAVLILGADDLLKEDKDGKATYVPRDNVIFELGAVMARLGMRRVFVVMPKDPHVKKLSYLNSILPMNVPDDGNWSPVAAQIVDSLKKLDEDLFHSDLPALGLVQGYFFNFVKPVITTLDQRQALRFEKSGASEWDPDDGWTFTIVIPEKPMGRADVDDFCKETLGTENVSVALRDGRDISVYARPRPNSDAPLHLVDVPTTLLTSEQVITRVDRFWGQGDRDFRDALAGREVDAFRRRMLAILEEMTNEGQISLAKRRRVFIVDLSEAKDHFTQLRA